MRKILFLLAVMILASCGQEKKEAIADKPLIAVSIVPQKYLVNGIADSLAEVLVMVPPGASPATWEATAAQMEKLGKSSLYLRIGHIGFEKAWMNRIAELNPDMKITDLSEGMKLRGMEYSHDGHTHTGIDPHIWMSPEHMAEMARIVYAELQQLFPEQKDFLRENYATLMQEIKAAGAYAKSKLSGASGKSYLIFHPSLGYLTDPYDLEQLSIEYEGKEPSAAHMKDIIDRARDKEIRLIFVQKEFDKRNAKMIADEIGGKVVEVDPLSENWAGEIRRISDALHKSLLP